MGEGFAELEARFWDMLRKWMAGCEDVEAVFEKLLVEQFLNAMPSDGLQMIISRPGNEMAGLSTQFILQQPGNVILVDLRNILPEIVHKSREQSATSSQDLILLSKSTMIWWLKRS